MALVVHQSSSSDGEDLILDTSRDFEFAQQFYGELNRALLGPPGDDKIVILSDSDEEKEVAREEKSTGTIDTAASATINPTSTSFVDSADAPAGARNNNIDHQGPDHEAGSGDSGRDDAGEQ
jgi:hypothetical protein